MTLDGALMGSVGDANVVDHKVVGAIASHTWGEYAHASKEFNAGHALETLLVELEVHARLHRSLIRHSLARNKRTRSSSSQIIPVLRLL